jgi:uncharacterized membrane protein YciS (DUF1049 family)
MKTIKVIFFLAFILLSGFLGYWVAQENETVVTFVLLGIELPEFTVGAVAVGSFAAGILLGLSASSLMLTWLLFRIRRLQGKVDQHSTGEES